MGSSAIYWRANDDDIGAGITFRIIKIARRYAKESEIGSVHVSDIGHDFFRCFDTTWPRITIIKAIKNIALPMTLAWAGIPLAAET